MTKPQEFREQRILSADTDYQVSGAHKGPYSGSGVLTTGRVVWVQKAEAAAETVAAYAEGVGVVSIDVACLK